MGCGDEVTRPGSRSQYPGERAVGVGAVSYQRTWGKLRGTSPEPLLAPGHKLRSLHPGPCSLWAASHMLPNVCNNFARKGLFTVSLLQRSKLAHGEFKQPALGRVTGKWQNWGLNLGFSASELMLLPPLQALSPKSLMKTFMTKKGSVEQNHSTSQSKPI